MLRDADAAMYCAKSSGKACYRIFDKNDLPRPLTVASLGQDLEQAIERAGVVAPLPTDRLFGNREALRF